MKPAVTEQTGKKYKAPMLLGVLLCCVSIVLMVSGSYPAAGPIGMIVGVGMYAAARIGAWWSRG